jgi:dihydroorotase
VTVIDPDVQWTFSTEKTFSKSKNSPFEGMDLIGKAVLTFNGEEIYRDALFEPGRETFL